MASGLCYFKSANVHRIIAISFVKTNYPLRVRYIVHLLENGVDAYASVFIDPRRTRQKGILTWIGLTILWALTLPLLRGLFPLLGRPLDKLALEQMATVGHVIAVKKGP